MPGWPDWQEFITSQSSWDILGSLNGALPGGGLDLVDTDGASYYEALLVRFETPDTFGLEIVATNTSQTPNYVRGIRLPTFGAWVDEVEMPFRAAPGDAIVVTVRDFGGTAHTSFVASCFGLPRATVEQRGNGLWLPMGSWGLEYSPAPPVAADFLPAIPGWRYLLHSFTQAIQGASTGPPEGLRVVATVGNAPALINRVDAAADNAASSNYTWERGLLCDPDQPIAAFSGSVTNIDIGIVYDIVK